jgi:Mrp family chromosome partitioning ATPase
LASPRFGELLKELSGKFDMVIIDTPPLGNIIDSALVSACADGTLLLVKAKAVDYRTAMRVKEQLEKANARIIGVVLNNIKKGDYRSYHNYYRYYDSGKLYGREWLGRLKKTKKARIVEA